MHSGQGDDGKYKDVRPVASPSLFCQGMPGDEAIIAATTQILGLMKQDYVGNL